MVTREKYQKSGMRICCVWMLACWKVTEACLLWNVSDRQCHFEKMALKTNPELKMKTDK